MHLLRRRRPLLALALACALAFPAASARADDSAEEESEETLHNRAAAAAERDPKTPEEFIEKIFAKAWLQGLSNPDAFAFMAFLDTYYHHPTHEGMTDCKVYVDEPMSTLAMREAGQAMRPRLLWRLPDECKVKMQGFEGMPPEARKMMDDAGKRLADIRWLLWDKTLLEQAKGRLVTASIDFRLGPGRSYLSFFHSPVLLQLTMIDLDPESHEPMKCFWVHPGPADSEHLHASTIHIEKIGVVYRDQGLVRYNFSRLGHLDVLGEFMMPKQVVFGMDHYPHNLMDLGGPFAMPVGCTWRFYRPFPGPFGLLWLSFFNLNMGGASATLMFNDHQVNRGISAEEWDDPAATKKPEGPKESPDEAGRADGKALAGLWPKLPQVWTEPPPLPDWIPDFDARWREVLAAANAGDAKRAGGLAGALAKRLQSKTQLDLLRSGAPAASRGMGAPGGGAAPTGGVDGAVSHGLLDPIFGSGRLPAGGEVTNEPADRAAREALARIGEACGNSPLGRQALHACARLGARGGRGRFHKLSPKKSVEENRAAPETEAERLYREAREHEQASRFPEALEDYFAVTDDFAASQFAPPSGERIRALMGDAKVSAAVRNPARELLERGKRERDSDRLPAALRDFTAVVEHFPTTPEADEARDLLFQISNAPPDPTAPAAPASDPNPPLPMLAFARANEAGGNPGAAIRAYARLAEQHPTAPVGEAAKARGDALWGDEKVRAALEAQATKRMGLGAECKAAGNLQGARDMFASVVEEFPRSAQVTNAKRELALIEELLNRAGAGGK